MAHIGSNVGQQSWTSLLEGLLGVVASHRYQKVLKMLSFRTCSTSAIKLFLQRSLDFELSNTWRKVFLRSDPWDLLFRAFGLQNGSNVAQKASQKHIRNTTTWKITPNWMSYIYLGGSHVEPPLGHGRYSASGPQFASLWDFAQNWIRDTKMHRSFNYLTSLRRAESKSWLGYLLFPDCSGTTPSCYGDPRVHRVGYTCPPPLGAERFYYHLQNHADGVAYRLQSVSQFFHMRCTCVLKDPHMANT